MGSNEPTVNHEPIDRGYQLPNQGSEAANWTQNLRRLKQEMADMRPIKDATALKYGGLDRMNTGFLARERAVLKNAGWKYSSGYWYPPK